MAQRTNRQAQPPLSAAIGLATLVLVAGCSILGDHSLQRIGEGSGTSYGFSFPLPDVGEPMTVLAAGLCRNGAASPTITRVFFSESDATMKVADWATRFRDPSVTTSGADIGDLTASGYDPASKNVNTDCATTDTGSTDLAIQVEASAVGRFKGSNLVVEYSAGSRTGSFEVPVTLVFCVGYPKGSHCEGE